MTKTYKFDPDYVVAPGETLDEWFEETNVPKSVSRFYGLDAKTLDGIIAGKRKITRPIAMKLAGLTFIPPTFWLAFEHNFRTGLAAGKTWTGTDPTRRDTP